MGRESRVVEGEWLVALDVTSGRAGPHTEALVRMAAAVAPEWIVPTSRAMEHRFDAAQGTVRAVDVERYDAIVVRERPVTPDAAVRAEAAGRAPGWNAEPDEATQQLLRRARFAGVELDLPALADAGGRPRRARSPISASPRRCRGR